MVNHICEKCNKEFNRKSNYDYHINNKKKPCKPKHINIPPIQIELLENPPIQIELLENPPKYKELKCKHCLKIFSRSDSLERHLNGRCKIIKSQKQENEKIIEKKDIIEQQNNNQVNIEELNIDDNTKMILTILMNQNKKLIEEIKIIKEENKEIKEKMNVKSETIINKNSNNTITNTNSNNTITNTNIIIAHGKEDLSKIELDTIMSCMSTIKHREIIPSITKHVYLNDSKPENKNFCVVDTARNKCKYFDGTKWVIGKTNDKVTKIFDNIHNMLTDPFEKEHINKTIEFIKANPKKYNEKWIKVSNTYLKSLYDEDDKENMENKLKVLEELKLIFFNNKDEILKIK
jgi:hypothetical protein